MGLSWHVRVLSAMSESSREATLAEKVTGKPLRTGELAWWEDILNRFYLEAHVRHVTVLKMRYGLGGSRPYTLQEIAEQVGISREAVRQIIDRALVKLSEMSSDSKVA